MSNACLAFFVFVFYVKFIIFFSCVFSCVKPCPGGAMKVTAGHLVNLATTDVERFQWCGTFLNYLWEAPAETLVILYFGISTVGVSFLAGFAALALLVPMQVGVYVCEKTELHSRVSLVVGRIGWKSKRTESCFYLFPVI